MHELSVVMSIIKIADDGTGKNNANGIEEIELDIGELSGVEMTAFDFAWEQAIKSTQLESSKRIINRIAVEGRCTDCNTVFGMQQLYEPCPACGQYMIKTEKGKEMRVKSLVLT